MNKQEKVDKLAKIIWDYHHMNHKLKKADVIMVMGSQDVQVAEKGAELFLNKFAPLIIFSGGFGRNTKTWKKPEAEVFADIAIQKGISRRNVIIENKSGNTGENVLFTKKLLEKRGIKVERMIVVQKPYMERRAYATVRKLWPSVDVLVTSPDFSLEKYKVKDVTRKQMINGMVGYIQRIIEYPKMVFQSPQKVSE